MPDQYSVLRHAIRGSIHALKLGVAVLETDMPAHEAVEFLDYMIQSADKITEQLNEYEALPWPVSTPAQGTQPTAP